MSGRIELHQRLERCAAHLRDYSGSESCAALVAWVDAAGDCYREELTSVTPEGLAALQAKVRQLEALKALALGAVQSNGRI